MNYTIIPIKSSFLHKVRQLSLDDLDQRVETVTAKGGEPCRDVLRGAIPGEQLLLASYCPFEATGPYREFGPVFVLKNPSNDVIDLSTLPLPQGKTTDFLGQCFVLKAYCDNERIIDATLTTPECAEADLQRLLQQAETHFVIARYAAYGCYSFRVERE